MTTFNFRKNRNIILMTIFILVVSSLACGTEAPLETISSVEKIEATETLEKPTQQPTTIISRTSTTSQEDLIDPTSTPTEPPETTRSNPVAIGSEGEIEYMIFVVQGMTRPATDFVMSISEMMTPPIAGQEYVMVELEITCDGSFDQRCAFETFNLKLVGSKGIVRNIEWGLGDIPDLIDDAEFFGGAVITGNAFFIVDQDETDLIMFYDPRFDFPLFLSLPTE